MAVLLGVVLICTNVISTQAEAQSKDTKDNATYEALPNIQNINKNLVNQIEADKISKPEASYSSTSDYPLKTDGDNVGKLWDSTNTFHDVYYEKIVEDGTDKMKISLLDYCDEAYNKDPYFNVEFLKDNGSGTTEFIGNSLGNFYGYTGVRYSVTFPKSWYENQEYIYIFIGLVPSLSSTVYSDFSGFKIKNPYYKGGGSTTTNGYVVASNESVNTNATQSTGTFSINNDKFSYDTSLSRDAYKMDVNIPFDGKANQDKLLTSKNNKSILKKYVVGDSKSFYVADMTNDSTYQISATLLYSGSHANVWVNNNQITQGDAKRLGEEFDSNIYTKVTSNFGNESDVDGDGKLEILCYDIKDGFSGSGGYIAGYFYAGDLYNVQYSNKCEMFYIDTYPAMWTPTNPKDVSKSYSTLAHEFQHMVNYNQSTFVERGNSMDVWLNEGMSMAAEQIYGGKALKDRIDYYNSSSSIRNGHSLLYWDYSGDTLSNYSLSYLFLQYFKLQVGKGDSIFKELQSLGNNNYKDIETLIKKYIDPNMTFGQFMTNFRIALLLKQNSGLRGFKGDAGFSGISTPMYTGSGTNLRGGGGVTKAIDTTKFKVPTNKGANVTFTVIVKGANTPPIINGVGDKTIKIGDTFDPKKGVTATDAEDGDLTKSIQINGTVNAKAAGSYKLTYSVSDKDGNKVSKSCTITVKGNSKPVITGASNKTIKVGDRFDPKAGVSASDKEDGNLTAKIVITNKVNTAKAGTYNVTYSVTDKDMNKVTISIKVTVLNVFKTFTINSIDNKQTSLTGAGLSGAKVQAYVNGKVVGASVLVNAKGAFKLTIPKQKAGTKLSVRMAKSNYATIEKSISVLNTFTTLTAASLTAKSTYVTGKGLKGATIQIYVGGKVIGKAVVASNGTYKVKIPKQKVGKKITIKMTKSGYRDAQISVTVKK